MRNKRRQMYPWLVWRSRPNRSPLAAWLCPALLAAGIAGCSGESGNSNDRAGRPPESNRQPATKPAMTQPAPARPIDNANTTPPVAVAPAPQPAPPPATKPADGPQREHVEIKYGPYDTHVFMAVVRPRGYDPAKRYPVVFTLPPGGGDADMVDANLDMYWEKEGYQRGYVIVCPQIFGPTLQREAATFIPGVFDWMDKNLSYDPARVVITGASNGGRGAFWAAVAAPTRFAGILVLPGAYSGDVEAAKVLAGKPVQMYVGDDDKQWRSMAEMTRQFLASAGVTVTVDRLPGQGHLLKIEPAKLYDWVDRTIPAK